MSCESILEDALEREQRIDYLTLNPDTLRVTVGFHGATEQDVEPAVDRAIAALRDQLAGCLVRAGKALPAWCDSCTVAPEHASFPERLISVSRARDPEPVDLHTLTRSIPAAEPGEETAVAPSLRARLVGGLSAATRFLGEQLEATFVAGAVVSLILGRVLEGADGAGSVSWAVYAVSYLLGGYFGLRAGLEKLRERTIDVDLLMILAAGGAALIGAPFEGALLLVLFSLSNVLQDYALERTSGAIHALMQLRPTTAEVVRSLADERRITEEMPIEDVTVGELVLVRPGGRIPLDGVVESGASAVDESMMTGESRPVDKSVDCEVLSGSINGSGALTIRVSREAGDSTIARIIAMVQQARENKARTEHFLNRFEAGYTIFVLLGTVVAAVGPPLILGEAWSSAFYRAITLMVAASPCALIISTPASVLSAVGNGAKRGILFKGGVYVEQAARTTIVAFDKTGTLTHGELRVSEVKSVAAYGGAVDGSLVAEESAMLAVAAALEGQSEHPIGRAVVREAEERGVAPLALDAFSSTAGRGVSGMVDGVAVAAGNIRLMADLGAPLHQELADDASTLENNQRTVVYVARQESTGWTVLGLIAVRDVLRADARESIAALRRAGVERIVMITGDNRAAAESIAREAGIDDVRAELLPDDKLRVIEELQREGRLAMIGDGVNDAPALARADMGVAMGARGTDVAMETADVVLMGDRLETLGYLFSLSRATRRTLVANLAIALGLIAMMVVGIFTIELPLPLAVLGHEGGTVLVSLNGLRLLWYRRT